MRRPAQAADRRNNDHRTAAALNHVRYRHVRQPPVAADIRSHHPIERVVRHAGGWPKIGVYRGILHQDVDAAALGDGLVHESLEFFLAGNVAGDDDGLAALFANAGGDRLTRVRFAAGNHHRRPVLGHPGGDGQADSLGGTRNDGDFAGQIEQ